MNMEPWTKADKERGRAGTFSELKTSLAHPRGSMPKVRWVGGGGERSEPARSPV